jgi:hypothetical protein
VVSKPQSQFENKVQADEKARSAEESCRISITKRLATQVSGLRRGFETVSKSYLKIRIFV